MNKLIYLGALIACTSCTSLQLESVEVTPYRDGRPSAISFTYDDGMLCHYTDIAPQLEKHGWHGTFWIIGANMGTDSPDYPWMTWEQVADLARRGHEISNHSWHHPDLTKLSPEELRWEVQYNDSVLESVTGRRPRTFCYPYNAMSDEVVRFCSENRVGTRTYQSGHGQIASHMTADSLSLWLADVIANHRWGVTMTHGTTYGWDYWTEPELLYRFFDEVKAVEDSVWVGTFEEVAAYTEEAKDIQIDLQQTSGASLRFTPSLKHLDPALFDQELTFLLHGSFPEGELLATQQGRSLTVRRTEAGVMLNARPVGDIELSLK